MQNKKFVFFTILFLLSLSSARGQHAENITISLGSELSSNKREYIIKYDLITRDKNKNIPCQIRVKWIAGKKKGETFYPKDEAFYLKEVRGDAGNLVYPGTNKKIIWDHNEELVYFKGEIKLEIEVTPSTQVSTKVKRGTEFIIPSVYVVDVPTIEWVSYQQDTSVVAQNIQTFTLKAKSRLPLQRIEIKINGLTMDVYESKDFAPAVDQNRFEQFIERTLSLRTGFNILQIIAENNKGETKESVRKIIVDPNQITVMRNKKDQTPPMIYLSEPVNLRNDRVVVYEDLLKISGTAIDEAGILQLTVNNTIAPVKVNGMFTIFIPLNVGETLITIEAKDVNQNIALKKFTIERKNTDGSVYNPTLAKNYLLVIGINNYNSSLWPILNNAVADAIGVRDILTSHYTFDSLDVTILLNEEATRANIYGALRKCIEKVSARDNLLIYYSGHGYFDKLLSEGYWVPIDAQGNDISAYVANSLILKIIENINSQHTFLVADACFSGSLFAPNTRGYTDHVEKYKSRWGLASGRLEVVSDGSSGTNSPFAQSFIEFLQNNKEEKVPVSDLVQYVKKKVTEANQQTPIGNPLNGVGDEGGEFIFYKRQ